MALGNGNGGISDFLMNAITDDPVKKQVQGDNPMAKALAVALGVPGAEGNGQGSISGLASRLGGGNPVDVGSATSTPTEAPVSQAPQAAPTQDASVVPLPQSRPADAPASFEDRFTGSSPDQYHIETAIPKAALPQFRDSLLTGAGLNPAAYRSVPVRPGSKNISEQGDITGIETRDVSPPGPQASVPGNTQVADMQSLSQPNVRDTINSQNLRNEPRFIRPGQSSDRTNIIPFRKG